MNKDESFSAYVKTQGEGSLICEGSTLMEAVTGLIVLAGGSLQVGKTWYFWAEETEPAIAKVNSDTGHRVSISTNEMTEELSLCPINH